MDFFCAVFVGGRGRVSKESSEGGGCHKGKEIGSYLLHTGALIKQLNGSTKTASFLGATRAPTVTLLVQIFKSIPILCSLAFNPSLYRLPLISQPCFSQILLKHFLLEF